MVTTEKESTPVDSALATGGEQTNGSSFMSLCLAATNRLLVEKHDVSIDEKSPSISHSNSAPSTHVDPSADAEQDYEPIMEGIVCCKDVQHSPDEGTLLLTHVASAAKKAKQAPVRQAVSNKGRRYVSGIRSGSKRDDQWNVMFLRLQDYKFENGTCNVPQGYAADAELATWVKNQRQAYRYMLERKTTKRISPERVTRLNHIGFEWRKYNKTEEEQARLRYNTKRHVQYIPPLYAPMPARMPVSMPPNNLTHHAQYTHQLHQSPYLIPPQMHQRIPPAGKLPYKPPPVTRQMAMPPTYNIKTMPSQSTTILDSSATLGTSPPGTATV